MALSVKSITILGSGTSTGVPVIGCDCAVCQSDDARNRRTRASILLTLTDGRHLVIDTGPDFRAQILRAKVRDLAAVLYTHLHADHVHGFDDLRAFYFAAGRSVPAYVHQEMVDEMKTRFAYAFQATGYAGTAPQVQLIPFGEGTFSVSGLEVEAVRLPHGHTFTVGFRMGDFAYCTDFLEIPREVIERWRGKVRTMVASGLRFAPDHPTHSVVPKTLAMMDELGVKTGVIGHLSHEVDYIRDSAKLPPGRFLAYDGLLVDADGTIH